MRIVHVSVDAAFQRVLGGVKIGVSTRAAATLFAIEHGLVASGELPIVRPATRS